MRFADGSELPADLVVMAAGVRPEYRAGAGGRPARASAACWSMTRCRPSIRPSTRWANACSTATTPSAWWRRCGSRRGSARPTSPSAASRRYRGSQASDAAQGQRHRCVLRRRFRGGTGRRVAGAARPEARHLQAPGHRGQQDSRRGAVRRYPRRRLVLRSDERRAATSTRCATSCCSARGARCAG